MPNGKKTPGPPCANTVLQQLSFVTQDFLSFSFPDAVFSSGGVYLACSAARVLPCTRRGVSIRRGLSRAAVTVRKCPGSSPAHRLGQCCGQGGWLLGGTGAAGERGALPRQPLALGDAGRSKGLARGRSVCGCLGQTPGSAVWLGLWHPAVSGWHGLPWGGFGKEPPSGAARWKSSGR